MTRPGARWEPSATKLENYDDLIAGGVNPLLAIQELGITYEWAMTLFRRAGRRDLQIGLLDANTLRPWLTMGEQDRTRELSEQNRLRKTG